MRKQPLKTLDDAKEVQRLFAHLKIVRETRSFFQQHHHNTKLSSVYLIAKNPNAISPYSRSINNGEGYNGEISTLSNSVMPAVLAAVNAEIVKTEKAITDLGFEVPQ